MRKILISLLLASALTPAAAYAQNSDRGGRAERGERSDDRPQREERAARQERPERAERAAPAERPQRAERAARVDRSDAAPRNVQVRPNRTERAARPGRVDRNVQQVVVTQPTQPVRTQRSGNELVDGFRSIARGENADRSGSRDGWRDGDRHRWNGDWRRDNRYDWRGHRSRYSSLYRLGRYFDPYGWGYRRFSIGFNLWPSYYGSSFWLNDTSQYRLPPAYGPYRWVRYYDDALLVNIYDGQVVDVIYNFFW